MRLADPGGWIVLALLLVTTPAATTAATSTTGSTTEAATAAASKTTAPPTTSGPFVLAPPGIQKRCYNETAYEEILSSQVNQFYFLDKDDHDPCFVWTREAGFDSKYPKPLVHGQDFWNIQITLSTKSSEMADWYDEKVNVIAGTLMSPMVCVVDLTECLYPDKPTTQACKCLNKINIGSEYYKEGNLTKCRPVTKIFTIYVSLQANVNQNNRRLVFQLKPTVTVEYDTFTVMYYAGRTPRVEPACKQKCDNLLKAANWACSKMLVKDRVECLDQGCPCKTQTAPDLKAQSARLEWIDPNLVSAADQPSVSLCVLTVLMCCWTMCSGV